METPKVNINYVADDFVLLGVDDKQYSLADVRGVNGFVVAFICNHCPYVQSIAHKLAREAKELQQIGIGFVGINANDTITYPEDSFDNMKFFAQKHDFSFPYLFDETQSVAKKYGAVCTPDFFGFNKGSLLGYRGRLDGAGKKVLPNAKRELFIAMKEVAEKGETAQDSKPSIGCSIKWKDQN